jgi:hypothetical protein
LRGLSCIHGRSPEQAGHPGWGPSALSRWIGELYEVRSVLDGAASVCAGYFTLRYGQCWAPLVPEDI